MLPHGASSFWRFQAARTSVQRTPVTVVNAAPQRAPREMLIVRKDSEVAKKDFPAYKSVQ